MALILHGYMTPPPFRFSLVIFGYWFHRDLCWIMIELIIDAWMMDLN